MLVSALLVASCISHVIGSALPNDHIVADLVTRENPGEGIQIINDDPWLKELGNKLKRRQDGNNFPYIEEIRKLLKSGCQIHGQAPPAGEVDPVQTDNECKLGCGGYCNPGATYTHSLLKEVKEVKVTSNPHIDEVFENPNADPLDIEVKKGTAETHGSTKGWSIGLELGGNIAGTHGPLSAVFSGQRTQLTQESRTETVEVTWKGKCPPRTECRVITMTFQLTVQGLCDNTGYVYCLTGHPTKRDMCGNDKYNLLKCFCPELQNRLNELCPPGQKPCTIVFPLTKPEGGLRSVQFIQEVPLKA
ncbi:hypothetical protein MGYG_05260 [Nannizzia gypsea CBS 118893]|uniref:Uncharacterized protein n=1 Tax=Arthroderma gypseum (strain ATCC MYA-4604 / CBS 118893) TaxID=535722 RepID=E4UVD2_ARTGP|nr:hypothetical protein MGYG_05260 [Nannizzia gypsea CBS 118893]EFR02259.1 hypothetical protein MGYG_05260 [Nannizzia gypsea CBS 118893]